MPPRKKKSTAKQPDVEATSAPEPAKAEAPAPKKQGPTQGSLIRKKRDLLCDLRDEHTPLGRQLEIRAELDGPLADVPNLSVQEISRLAD